MSGFAGTAVAATAPRWDRGPGPSPIVESRSGMVGLGFGFGPWWGPYDAYAPPAYAYPGPIHSVPPPPPGSKPRFGACREFDSTVIVDGQPRIARGYACPQPDGSWRIVR